MMNTADAALVLPLLATLAQTPTNEIAPELAPALSRARELGLVERGSSVQRRKAKWYVSGSGQVAMVELFVALNS